jgi:hypothetical protein
MNTFGDLWVLTFLWHRISLWPCNRWETETVRRCPSVPHTFSPVIKQKKQTSAVGAHLMTKAKLRHYNGNDERNRHFFFWKEVNGLTSKIK